MKKKALLSMSKAELELFLQSIGVRKFRAGQLLSWILKKGVLDIRMMTDISIADRDRLSGILRLLTSRVAKKHRSSDGTIKLCIELHDGEIIESALIREKNRLTACLSTQAGCPVRCAFCASGAKGLKRNLESFEIVEQIVHANLCLENERVNYIVFMGIGEPLANFENLVQSINMITARWGLDIGARRITVSTVGIPDRIIALSKLPCQINLALSLHSADDEVRKKLIPYAKKYPIKRIVESAEKFFEATGREVTFEYVLLDGVNASAQDAGSLAHLLEGVRGKVNLIPYNEIRGSDFKRPDDKKVRSFSRTLSAMGRKNTIRREKGGSISAACGQLRLLSGRRD